LEIERSLQNKAGKCT